MNKMHIMILTLLIISCSQEQSFEKFGNRYLNEIKTREEHTAEQVTVIIWNTQIMERIVYTTNTVPKKELVNTSYNWVQSKSLRIEFSDSTTNSNGEGIIYVKGIENGVYAEFHFSRIGEKWFLTKVFNASS